MKHEFDWQRHPEAEQWVVGLLEEACRRSHFLKKLQEELLNRTSSRLLDWIDHFVVGEEEAKSQELEAMGYRYGKPSSKAGVLYHPGAQLPRVLVSSSYQGVSGVAFKVDRISDFLIAHHLQAVIEGTPLSGYRRALVSEEGEVDVWAVERRGTLSVEPTHEPEGYTSLVHRAYELWAARPRQHGGEDRQMAAAISIAEEMVGMLGVNAAAALVMEAERRYWEVRNTAGQRQKARQDRLGMGWANHDHHTFRSSRRQFHHLVHLFEILGFHCRERFYAGEEAGWGAQVMENTEGGFVLFLDVDLDPKELEIDFAHKPLPPLDHYNTVGLWCALHGDSILRAGMHHLECQFMFDELRKDLDELGVGMMQAFSDFSYLKQAFTKGERWEVDPGQVEKLVQEGMITKKEGGTFLKEGAVGSHLENLQRRDGYKGFNQKNVSFIISETDPRKLHV